MFGSGLDYARAFVMENTALPNVVAYAGRSPRPNAISLGNISYFPLTLATSARDIASNNLKAMAWLIHELAHQWQFQRFGWSYLYKALWVHMRQGQNGYRYHLTPGQSLLEYNMEQQADIARDYYCALKLGMNCARTARLDWQSLESLVAEFRAPP